MEVQIEILTQTITGLYGTLNPGDTLRTDAAFARHLVHDCRSARYAMPKPVAAPVAPADIDVTVQTSALIDPYANLGTLIATVSESTEDGGAVAAAAPAGDVQTSAQTASEGDVQSGIETAATDIADGGAGANAARDASEASMQTSAEGEEQTAATAAAPRSPRKRAGAAAKNDEGA